jgi:hypothetical protein
MKRLIFAGTVAFSILQVTGCENVSQVAEDQRAYNACVSDFNKTFRTLPDNKAMVSGVSSSRTSCFWGWNFQTIDAAINTEMNDCRSRYDRCFLFASNEGSPEWVDEIDNNGGLSSSTIAARRQRQEENEAVSAFIGALSQGLHSGSGSTYVRTPTYTPNVNTSVGLGMTPSLGNITAPSIPNYPAINYSIPTITPNVYNSSSWGSGTCDPHWVAGVNEACQ